MKKVVNNLEEFLCWKEEQKKKYIIHNRKVPNEFPCIIVFYIIENDYFDSPDGLGFDFVYKKDFEII